MAKSLVIVESPAKAKTINKYLGKDFIVKSSVGHIRDLPTSASANKTSAKSTVNTRTMSPEEKAAYKAKRDKKALVTRMGIDPENDWQANYQVLPGKEKVVSELQKLAEKADKVYLATDLDREGEAIAWHLKEVIGGSDDRYQRVVFNEITKTAIQEAFSHPIILDHNKVDAQQTRRFLDRVVGFMVSPLLWKKVARGLSAGRVQSVAVRLVVEKEAEIKQFIPEEFWEIKADLSHANSNLIMDVTKYKGEQFRPANQAETEQALNALNKASYSIIKREDKPTSSKPKAPFITSTLQQAASTRLNFGVKKTMMLAQRLYEAGHITYMRTDSTNLSNDAVQSAREFISKEYGEQYLPENPNRYGAKENAQEAHEAIRPSDVNKESALLLDMEPDAKRLYELIWRQFVACQMVPAKFNSSAITVAADEYTLKATGRIMKFDGYTKVMPAMVKGDGDRELPNVQAGDSLSLNDLIEKQNFTKPPARFNEASLVKELEKRGIGRPSTYASIISTIQDRGYVRVENRRFFAEKMGEIVTDRLVNNFSELLNYDFTAQMENTLDHIANGETHWKTVLNNFYSDFSQTLDTASLEADEGGMRPNDIVLTDIKCPTCERQMGIRTATTGVFLGCSGYQLPPKERCKTTINLTSGDEAIAAVGEDVETHALMAKRRCPVCETAMDSYLIDESRKLHVCGNNPQCHGVEIETGQFKIKGYDGPLIECDKCGSDMQLKNGRFGKYFGCTAEECKNTRKLLKNGEAAPPKEDPIYLPELPCEKHPESHFVLRDGASGIFLAASSFPKVRETRPPTVAELVRFKDRIWDKYQFLTEAPLTDPEGNPTFVKFKRAKEEDKALEDNERVKRLQYVASNRAEDGKPSGWSAIYQNGEWIGQGKVSKPKVAKKS